jgi:hypothetical protein
LNHEKATKEPKGKYPSLSWKKNLLIPMSKFLKCAQGADSAAAKVCNFWHLKSSPICLKLNSHQFAFLMTKNGPLQAEISKFWVPASF